MTTEHEAKYGGPSECGVLWLQRSHPHEADPDSVPFTEWIISFNNGICQWLQISFPAHTSLLCSSLEQPTAGKHSLRYSLVSRTWHVQTWWSSPQHTPKIVLPAFPDSGNSNPFHPGAHCWSRLSLGTLLTLYIQKGSDPVAPNPSTAGGAAPCLGFFCYCLGSGPIRAYPPDSGALSSALLWTLLPRVTKIILKHHILLSQHFQTLSLPGFCLCFWFQPHTYYSFPTTSPFIWPTDSSLRPSLGACPPSTFIASSLWPHGVMYLV